MASKKGTSYQWRIFIPIMLSFWVVIISMAFWQLYRVREIKREMVFDQLTLVGERICDLYDNHTEVNATIFMEFVNDFYEERRGYDPLNIFVRAKNDSLIAKYGEMVVPMRFEQVPDTRKMGMLKFKEDDPDRSNHTTAYLYYRTLTEDSIKVAVFLPYTNKVATNLSYSTARFWLIFFGIAIFVTIFAYISSLFLARNIRILRDFARKAAEDPTFISPDMPDRFPHDELGDISRQIVTIYNQRIAEFEARERDHKVALNAIDEKDRIKRELTSNINHELKTPVGVIQGYIDTIVDNPDMDDATRERFLHKTQESVHRLTALINDITLVTKLDSGGKLVNVSEIDFHDLVYRFDNYLNESKVLQGKMKFTYDIPLNCKVFANESLLTAALLNLTKNAVAYSKGTECTLEYVKEDKEYVYFSYYDDGVGVAPEHLPHLFERFYRVTAGRSRETGGTGLGLPIVEVTITSFGGSIEVVNHFPQGLQFDFRLLKTQSKKKDPE